MGKLSAEQTRQLKELEELRDADDDEETFVWVRRGDHETRLTGDRAKRWLRANGYDEDEADDSSQAEPLEEKGAPKKAAKKAAAPAAKGAAVAPEEEEPLEQDASAVKNRRSFF